MAANGISFSKYFLQACGVEPSNGAIRGMAIGVATFACLIHGTSRKLGIVINNVFGVIKVAMLLMIIIVGICAGAGVFGQDAVARDNLGVNKSFQSPSTDSYGYTEAFLAIIFAFGGFNQANYVLGEIDQPQRKYKVTAISTVALISGLYILVNVAYVRATPSTDAPSANKSRWQSSRNSISSTTRDQWHFNSSVSPSEARLRIESSLHCSPCQVSVTSWCRHSLPLEVSGHPYDTTHAWYTDTEYSEARNCERRDLAILQILRKQHQSPQAQIGVQTGFRGL